ncbi:peptide ABC transporter substrate-binding protein [Bradyrhizobium sp. UFLA03-84]|uniref:ABC transporter substrate-binding protein n=1 Tax=Bradyrhizobium sp. UFLA03-84 TaxID=418599 RepID=UPI000BAE4694|nr:ABC transporter substrate-binding protein [Bradyrhizobium sp. UFLA03-84]PAY04161.1 peptide ABC transporter substrate-binding protein [Bradyrhizobium sp. UFLA03-84]
MSLRLAACIMALGVAAIVAGPASAQKKGGTLRLYHNDNPPSTSLLEESTIASVMPFAAVFNNLVVFDPAKVHESIDTVIPDLAESWSWDSTNTKLTFKLHHGVKWHDGQPFTAKDVQCTWRMLIGKSETQDSKATDFKRNPRKVWYSKLKDVSVNGDDEATFELTEPQPGLLALLASAFSVVYPCHVPQQVMRTKPIGTGPFKFVEFRRGDSIRLVRNPDYFKKDRPYLDEITVRSIDSRATRMLAFATGDYDITFPSDVSIPLMKDVKARAPNAICEMTSTNLQINLLVNRVNPPFDNPEIRKAMSLALDRKAFNSILFEGTGRLGGAMQAKPEGEWGMPPEMLSTLMGYGPDTEKNLADAQAIMQKLGYSGAKPLSIKIQTRNLPTYRDPAVILADQLKKIYIVAELDILDTPRWYSRLQRKDYTIGLNVTGVSVDDPDGNLVENYSCNSERNYTQYCNAEVDKLLAAQSREVDKDKRRKIVFDIERLLVDDAARPVILHSSAGNCWQPYVKNFHPHDNSQYNNLRFEDVWLDK